MASASRSPTLGRKKTREDLQREERLGSIVDKPLRGEPQLIVKEIAAGLTVANEKTNILAALKIANIASKGGIILKSIIVRGVPLVLIALLEISPRKYTTKNFLDKRSIDPVMQEKVAGAAAVALTVIYPRLNEQDQLIYIGQDIVGKAMKLWHEAKNSNVKNQAHSLLRVLGVLRYLPYVGNGQGKGGFMYLPYQKFERTLGTKPTQYPKASANNDSDRLMFREYEEVQLGNCPHCKQRDHWIDTCPVRKDEAFAELQDRMIRLHKRGGPVDVERATGKFEKAKKKQEKYVS